MRSDAVTIGLVGCGRLAEVGYLPALVASPAVRLVAVADPDTERRAHLAELASAAGRGQVGRFGDAESLLAGAAVDALILASPAGAHLHDAALAAARQVPVLVEKPPAPDAPTAAELARLSPVPWVGFNRRFDPGAAAVRAALPADGPLDLTLEIRYRRRSWRALQVHDDALGDLGPHLVDWARWLTRSDVVGVARAEVTAARASIDVVLDRGRAQLVAAVDQPHRELVEVRRPGGTVVASHSLGGLVAAVRDRLSGSSGPHALATTLARQLDAFAAAVRGEPAPELGTASDGCAVMAVLDAARASAAQRSPVPVAQPGKV